MTEGENRLQNKFLFLVEENRVFPTLLVYSYATNAVCARLSHDNCRGFFPFPAGADQQVPHQPDGELKVEKQQQQQKTVS